MSMFCSQNVARRRARAWPITTRVVSTLSCQGALALRGQLLGDLLAHKRLDHVTVFDIGEALESDPAFITTADPLDIVLETAERANTTLIDHHVVAQQPTLGIARYAPLGHIAAGDHADARDMEGLAHLRTAHGVLGHL